MVSWNRISNLLISRIRVLYEKLIVMQLVQKKNLANFQVPEISFSFSQKCLTLDLILAVTPDF